MTDDSRKMLTAALNPFVPFVFDKPDDLIRLRTPDELADAALTALHAAGYRLVLEDDLRWLVNSIDPRLVSDRHSLDRYDPDVPPGVRALLHEMEDK